MSRVNRREFIKRSSCAIAASVVGANFSENLPALGTDASISRAKSEIEKVRMRNVNIRLVDRRGEPVTNIPVNVTQVRQGFIVGDQLCALDTMFRHGEHDTDHARRWKQKYLEAFNAASVAFHWPDQSVDELEAADPEPNGSRYCVNWATEAGLSVRGHSLFWPIAQAIPASFKVCGVEERRKILESRIRKLVSAYRGKVSIWDVVTEPSMVNGYCDGSDGRPCAKFTEPTTRYIAQLLQWSRQEDSGADLVIRDYGLDADVADASYTMAADSTQRRQNLVKLIKNLREVGVSPNAVALQPYTGRRLEPSAQLRLYDEISTAEVPIHVTGFWCIPEQSREHEKLPQDVRDQILADYAAAHLTCAFSHPNVESFFFWGFMSQAIRWPSLAQCEPTIVYKSVSDLINNQWMTHKKLSTDADGHIQMNGFIGDYVLSWPSGSDTHEASFSIKKSNPVLLTVTS